MLRVLRAQGRPPWPRREKRLSWCVGAEGDRTSTAGSALRLPTTSCRYYYSQRQFCILLVGPIWVEKDAEDERKNAQPLTRQQEADGSHRKEHGCEARIK